MPPLNATPSQLSLLLPMPLLLFAWLSACANAFAWHLTPLGHSKFQHRLRLRPMTLNLITWITPIFIFAVNLTLVILWPMIQQDAKALKARLSKCHFLQLQFHKQTGVWPIADNDLRSNIGSKSTGGCSRSRSSCLSI